MPGVVIPAPAVPVGVGGAPARAAVGAGGSSGGVDPNATVDGVAQVANADDLSASGSGSA